ncbi:VanZ family protein [Paenibacillus cellulosilyticus]|uniref:VanZ family protein n=1 Tax=Paenibacillus cellulosilyticus TaxID=375489 RepID=A0A2V2Z0Q6_9BACL|nr:VanZ family protein [Paenibacillus cellulosilyticus]PWW06159.1 VanZ family protein [Paenibacillus cellulosilyticus]QKS43072.1 VanZ family protein [Paenibacillus cellulosilyticus]
MKQSRLRFYRLIPALLVMAAIYWLSDQPGSEMNSVFLPWFQELFPAMEGFNWGHYAAYFVLALTFDYFGGKSSDKWLNKVIIVLLCTLYGVTDEYHQLFVEGRTTDYQDLLHDAIGAAAAVLLVSVPAIRQWWRRVAN